MVEKIREDNKLLEEQIKEVVQEIKKYNDESLFDYTTLVSDIIHHPIFKSNRS